VSYADAIAVIWMTTTPNGFTIAPRFVNPTKAVGGGGRR